MKKEMKVVAATAFSCLLTLASCQKEQPMTGVAGTYKTMTVKPENRELTSTYSATIRGRQDIEIYPQVGGTLQKLCVTEGERVRKGQTLFIIDQVPYQAALKTAVANVHAAEAALATARLTLQSKQNLFDQKIVSDFDLQQAKNNVLSAEAALAQAEAQRVNAQNSLSYTTVKSPADGVVGTLPYRQGALVGSNMPQPLTVVSDNSQMYVYFSMTENKLLEFTRKYGTPEKAIENMPDLKLTLSDGTEYDQTGRIETISGVVDRSTGSVSLRAVFPNPSHLLHSGSSGNIIIPVKYDSCIVIPQEATFPLQDKTMVYKVIDGKATSVNVTVAPNNNGKEYIVLDGLKAGEEIIAEGAGLVREGTPVKASANK